VDETGHRAQSSLPLAIKQPVDPVQIAPSSAKRSRQQL
jgi:hypothetical protein